MVFKSILGNQAGPDQGINTTDVTVEYEWTLSEAPTKIELTRTQLLMDSGDSR